MFIFNKQIYSILCVCFLYDKWHKLGQSYDKIFFVKRGPDSDGNVTSTVERWKRVYSH